VWSLVTGGSTYIQYPVHPDKGYAFRKDGRYFVLAERHKSKDTIGIYDVKEHFRLVRVSVLIPLVTTVLIASCLLTALCIANIYPVIHCHISYGQSPSCLGRTFGGRIEDRRSMSR
jgi:hypothetical protein